MNIDITLIKEILIKLRKKDHVLFTAVQNKITQIAELDSVSIQHFKNLRGNLSNYKRVHVGNFVLMFKVVDDTVIFTKFCHHDEAY